MADQMELFAGQQDGKETVILGVIANAAREHTCFNTRDGERWLDGLRTWILFHLPRLALPAATICARGLVNAQASRVGRGLPFDQPLRVPAETRAIWEG